MASDTLGAIILAAGRAQRMGADKMLLRVAGQPMIAHVIAAARAAQLAGPIVVTRPADTALIEVVQRAGAAIVPAHDFALGMAHSLAAGMRAAPPAWRGVFILLGDMPFVSPDLLGAMVARATDDAIVIPTWKGRRGNPVLWGRAHFGALAALSGDMGGRVLWAAQSAHIVEQPWHDASIFVDIDTPADVRALPPDGGLPRIDPG